MSSPTSTANDGPHCAATGDHAIGRAQGEEGPPHERVMASGGEDALQDEPVRPQQAAAVLTAAQANGCRRLPSSDAAVKHSLPHGVVTQVVSPEIAAFMEGERVVVRTHQDELCCVDTVEVVSRDPAVCAAVVKCLEQFPHLVRLKFARAVVDAAVLAAVGNLSQLRHLQLSGCRGVDATGLAAVGQLSQLQHLDLSGCNGVDAAGLAAVAESYLSFGNLTSGGVSASIQQGSLRSENSSSCSILSSDAVTASMRQGSPRSVTYLSFGNLTSAGVAASMRQGSLRSGNSPSFSILTSAGATASIQKGSQRSENCLSFSILTSAIVTASIQQDSPRSENCLCSGVLTSPGVTVSMRQGSPQSDNYLIFST